MIWAGLFFLVKLEIPHDSLLINLLLFHNRSLSTTQTYTTIHICIYKKLKTQYLLSA